MVRQRIRVFCRSRKQTIYLKVSARRCYWEGEPEKRKDRFQREACAAGMEPVPRACQGVEDKPNVSGLWAHLNLRAAFQALTL